MALDLNFDIKTSKDCKNLILIENSGNYSETNPGGWGSPNPTPINKILLFSVQCYFEVPVNAAGGKKIINPIISFSSEMDSYANFVLNNNVQGLRMSIPYSDLYIEFYNSINETYSSLGLTLIEKNYVISHFKEWETVEDHIYMIGVNLFNSSTQNTTVGTSLNINKIIKFNSICNIQNKLEDHLTMLDFRCEDCDDQDIKDVAFYNVLLQNLKNA